ncbi:cell division protein [Caulobacter sp. CCUG 60055]|uniref:cell division protein FtsL n=1 Tax=Caulobacter sp. CCUG 60055 TaxID=2100090 RepID=UPI001FA75FB6|nr:cell division protein [Caulobacter sp. CCUG 60055]MCI3181170.1 cell division protein [Caulobacter sp. CCUG 60055]
MSLSDLFDRRVRGFRVIEVGALAVLLALALGVYLSKTGAGREGAETAKVQREIQDERSRIRMLRAEVAYLEQPERIERLSSQYLGLQPTVAKRETDPDALVEIARDAAMAKPAKGGAASTPVPPSPVPPPPAAPATTAASPAASASAAASGAPR